MNIHDFKNDLVAAMEKNSLSQRQLSQISGVEQCNLSKIINGNTDMRLSTALKLWPFIYGEEPNAQR